ncbi:hypothetical protein [Actinomadura rupiterrae]|uniref:hypothetical protein n=1 Tax=Actinomadura rupiterrae TaxID=559627 RepID=UPI0020A2F58D|nr:hypothetical protein [Actinomadura rupiterrae]MCP2336592.1 hypothetical protein [Actinomadura rupiterrae]
MPLEILMFVLAFLLGTIGILGTALESDLSVSAWVLIAVTFISGIALYVAVTDSALAHRGTVQVCQVTDVKERVRVESGGDNATTTTDYVHKLRCPSGGPSQVTTSRREASAGDRMSVTSDPRHRIPPKPTKDVWHFAIPLWAWFLAGTGILFLAPLEAAVRAAFRRR